MEQCCQQWGRHWNAGCIDIAMVDSHPSWVMRCGWQKLGCLGVLCDANLVVLGGVILVCGWVISGTSAALAGVWLCWCCEHITRSVDGFFFSGSHWHCMLSYKILQLFDHSYEAICDWYCRKWDMILKQDSIGDSFCVGVLHDNLIASIIFSCWSDVKTCLSMHSLWLTPIRFDVWHAIGVDWVWKGPWSAL